MEATIHTLEQLAMVYGKPLELIINSNQKPLVFVVKSADFCAYGYDCPEQAIKNFEYKVALLNAIESDIRQVEQHKKATEDFKNLGLEYILNLYECYCDKGGNFIVDHDRKIDPIKFFDEALNMLNDMAQTVKAAKSIDDMDFLPVALGVRNDLDRGCACTIWDGYSDKVFASLINTIQEIQEFDCCDFDTIV
jgi:hypothetical protein